MRNQRLIPIGAALLMAAPSAPGFTLLSTNQVIYVNVDHAPMGTCSTITYGLTPASGPWSAVRGDYCGLWGAATADGGAIPYFNGGGGVVFAVARNGVVQALPFVASSASIATHASFFSDAGIHRVLTPGADQWTIDGAGLTFTHYSPPWFMPSLDTATLADKKRFFLPATWIAFTVANTNSAPEDLYFGLPMSGTPATFANGAYQGFLVGEALLAAQTGSCDLLTGPSLTTVLNGMTPGFAFHLNIPAGQTKSLTVVLGYYTAAAVDPRIGAPYYYTSLFSSADSVVDAAFAGFADAQARCAQLAAAMANAGLNPYRQFLACHSLQSYMANTACLRDPQGNVYWRVTEGQWNYINTFDLTVDIAFYDALMHPWTLRNVLDTFSGALPGAGYSFNLPLWTPGYTSKVAPQGFSYHHDLGDWPTTVAPYPSAVFDDYMGAEQLQNWILDAGLYWSHSGDNAWLTNSLGLLQTNLNSLLLRDSPTPAQRNGIVKYVNDPEGTTFDDLDASLQASAYSGRLTVRNWACYVALQAMFSQIGDAADAATCQTMAATTAQTIVSLWHTYQYTLGYLPALLDGSEPPAAIIPMVEGLAYPLQMGLTNAVDPTGGPYAAMLQALSNHLAAVLVPGRCLDATSRAWKMTSASDNTWQSKMYLCQYVAEHVLGMSGTNINGAVDQVHATIQTGSASFYEWSDQTDSTGGGAFIGGSHYPRGITSALWWLNPTNNPGYPVATSAPAAPAGLTALPGNRQIVLFWNGVALARGYDLKRATASGGPYAPLTNGLPGASYTDAGLADGMTYYYVVAATNQAGEGLPSLPASATVGGPVPAAGTNITAALNGGNVVIAWPANYLGWILQTNGASLASAAWGDVPGSATNVQATFPVANPAAPAEFFRLRHP